MKKLTSKTKKPQTTNAEPAEEASPAEKVGSHPGKRILSLAIDPSLHSKLTICARCEGISVTQLVTDAVSKNLKARISAALESLKADLDK
jgi:predicted HicB family RNase H-like nuclease